MQNQTYKPSFANIAAHLCFSVALFIHSGAAWAADNLKDPQTLELMAIGDSAWIQANAVFGEKTDLDIHPRLEGISKFKAADLNFINLEASIVPHCKKFLPKPFTFAIGPKTLESFARWGFNFIALANNHTADCMSPLASATIDGNVKTIQQKFPRTLFHGLSATRKGLLTPATTEIRGITIGFVSIKAWGDKNRPYLGSMSNYQDLFKSLHKLKGVDFRVLSIHGGTERSRIPSAAIMRLARSFVVDYGGDLVIGHHPHVISGTEVISKANGRNALIVYSLGNGLHNGLNGARGDGKVLKLNLNKKRGVEKIAFYPLKSNSFELSEIGSGKLKYYKSQILAASSLLYRIPLRAEGGFSQSRFSLEEVFQPGPGVKLLLK